MRNIITFSGIARSGKDTAALYALDYFKESSKSYTFANKLKEIALNSYGLTVDEFNNFCDRHQISDCYISDENFYENKTPITRSLLIAIGKIVHEVRPNYFAEYIFEKIKTDNHQYNIITDLRFSHEYKILMDLQEEFKITKVHVIRHSVKASSEFYNDASEQDLYKFDYDYVIDNSGTLDEFKSKVIDVCKKIKPD